MGRRRRFAVIISLAALTLGVFASGGGAAPRSNDSSVNKDLARARRATAKFHSVAAAEAAGYTGVNEPCVEEPGLGAMGIHFINPPLLADPAIDLERPE